MIKQKKKKKRETVYAVRVPTVSLYMNRCVPRKLNKKYIYRHVRGNKKETD